MASDYKGKDFDKAEKFILHDLVFGYRGLPFPAGSWTEELPTLASPVKALRSGANILKSIVNKNGYAVKVFLPIELGGLYLPIATIQCKDAKNIKEIPLTNRNGTVKELISIGDWAFRIQGIAVEDEWPEEFIADLNDLWQRNESVEIKCALTDLLLPDERQVVIKNLNLPVMKGHPNSAAYELDLVSDINFEMEITENAILGAI